MCLLLILCVPLFFNIPCDYSPSFSSQCLFNHAVCVNELCLVYRCVGRTQGYRSDCIDMRTLSSLSLSESLVWFKWKSSLVFTLLQMSANACTYTQADNGRLLSVRRLSADLFDSRPVISLSASTQPYYLRRCLKMRNVLVCTSRVWIVMFVSSEMCTCVCRWSTYREVRERRPVNASSAISEIWFLLKSLQQH